MDDRPPPPVHDRPLPLSGVTVIDLTQIYNGPYATFMMAMAGADVIKIEPPGGEHLRRRGVVGGAALPFAMLNANKRAVTLNLKSERGRDLSARHGPPRRHRGREFRTRHDGAAGRSAGMC